MSRGLRWAASQPGVVLLVVVGMLMLYSAHTAVVPLFAHLADTDVTDGTGVAPPPPAVITTPVAAKAASSAVTVTGTGEFAALKVTVGQTRDLINQTVRLTWTGGRPTNDPAAFDVNYLQVMQCWGDAATGPERTQCEFGGNVAFDTRGGLNAASRQLTVSSYKDGKDPLLTKAAAGADVFVPFVSVTGVTVAGAAVQKNQFYDNTTSNELDFARIRGDGRGEALFETQTYREAPGLGCGKLRTSGASSGQPRSCWLVIVPRGETEVDGSARAAIINGSSHRLDTSPLSTTNWSHRLVVPLVFLAVGAACPISAAAKQTTGVESATELVLRWQPALCRNNGPVFGYAQSPDATAERTLVTDDPGLVLVNAPAPAPPSDRLYTYAPVALSGLVIAGTVERQTPGTGTAAERARDGEPMPGVNLTARLVAKLLTQSYTSSAPGGTGKYLQKNVENLTKDPDFLALNPDFKGTAFANAVDLLTPIGLASSTDELWQWISADQDAADFVAGLPDPWGMRVNPFYQGTSVPRQDFPKVDPYCPTVQAGAPPLCTLDEHPYAGDLHEAARSAARGDALSRNRWDANANPPAWKKQGLQLTGRRQLLALTDSATAARYGLVVAKLRNSAGQFVAPTSASLLAAQKVMRASAVPGVLLPDPVTSSAAAYPLPLLTYAVTAANIVKAADAKAFAGLVRYAAGAGQVSGVAPGTLPAGYVPLPAALRTQALAAAKTIEARKGPTPSTSAASTAGTAHTTAASHTTTSGRTSTAAPPLGVPSLATAAGQPLPTLALATGSPAPGSVGPAPVTPSPLPAATGTPAVAIAQTSHATPDESAGSGRYALVTALLLGLAASILGPALPRLARRLRQ